MDDEFWKQIKLAHADRMREERYSRIENPPHLVYIKTDYRVWCRIEDNEITTETFKEYLAIEKPEINFWDKKWLLKQLFGLEFEYNYKMQKWEQKVSAD